MSFVWGRALAVAQKEVYHVLRDPFTVVLSLVLPIVIVLIFGYAIEFNVKNISLAVFDADQTQTSRRLIETFSSSNYFMIDTVTSPSDAQIALTNEEARAALIIPGGFQKDLFSKRIANAQVLLDGSDNSTVTSVLGYLTSIQNIADQKLANYYPIDFLDIKTRFLFNPELNSRWFIIPGLAVVVMAILSVLLTALTVAREWENGSMELLLSTPLQPLEIIVGKIAPYGVLCIAAVIMVYVLSRTLFAIPFAGSLWVFSLGCILFLLTYLAQGLVISVVTRSQQLSVQIAIMSGLLPAQLLSGFIFPIDSMPVFFQYFTMILPARWFMTIARYSYLRGATVLDLWLPFLALSILCSIMIFLALKKFKTDLEP